MPRRLPAGALVAALAAVAFALCALASATPARAAEIARFALPAGVPDTGASAWSYAGPVVVGGTVVWAQAQRGGGWLVLSSAGGPPRLIGWLPPAESGGGDTLVLHAGSTQVAVGRFLALVTAPKDGGYEATGRDVLAGPPNRMLRTVESWRGRSPAPACLDGSSPSNPFAADLDAVAFRACTGPEAGALRVLDLRSDDLGPPIAAPPGSRWQVDGEFVSAASSTSSGCAPATCPKTVVDVWRWRDGAPVGATTLPGEVLSYRVRADGTPEPVSPAHLFDRFWPQISFDPPLGDPSPLDHPVRIFATDHDRGSPVEVARAEHPWSVPSAASDGTTAAFIAATRCGVARVLTVRAGATPLRFAGAASCPQLGASRRATIDRNGRIHFAVRCPACRGVLTADLLIDDGDTSGPRPYPVATARMQPAAGWRRLAPRIPRLAALVFRYGEAVSASLRLWLVSEDSRATPLGARVARLPVPLPASRSGL